MIGPQPIAPQPPNYPYVRAFEQVYQVARAIAILDSMTYDNTDPNSANVVRDTFRILDVVENWQNQPSIDEVLDVINAVRAAVIGRTTWKYPPNAKIIDIVPPLIRYNIEYGTKYHASTLTQTGVPVDPNVMSLFQQPVARSNPRPRR